jgi:hypothetical protein
MPIDVWMCIQIEYVAERLGRIYPVPSNTEDALRAWYTREGRRVHGLSYPFTSSWPKQKRYAFQIILPYRLPSHGIHLRFEYLRRSTNAPTESGFCCPPRHGRAAGTVDGELPRSIWTLYECPKYGSLYHGPFYRQRENQGADGDEQSVSDPHLLCIVDMSAYKALAMQL